MTHFLQRTTLIALATGALGACSTASPDDGLRPNFPIRTPQAQAAPAPAPATAPPPAPRDEPMVQTRPAAPVESRPLAPLAQPRPAPPPAPSFKTVTTRSVTGKVVEVEGKAVSYEVKKGDNLEKIARKLDTTVEQLKDDNGLKKGVIHPGQTLEGPRSTAKAYVAGAGDTLFAIGRRFGVSAEALRDENDLSRNASIRAGQKIRLPDGYHDKGAITSTSRVQVAGTADSEPAAIPMRDVVDPPRASGRSAAPQAASAPTFKTVTTRSVTGKVVEVEGPAVSYEVKKGDNLEKIARKLDTTVDALKDDNKLKKSAIQPGQTLKGPRTTAKAYVAGSGDTLAAIGKRFGVSVEDLRSENDLGRNASVRPGQKIRLPDGYRDKGPITSSTRVAIAAPVETAPEPRPTEPRRPESRRPEPRPYVPLPVNQPATPAPAMPAPSTAAPSTPTPRPYTPPVTSAPRPYSPPTTTTTAPRPYTPGVPSGTPAAAPTSAPPPSDAQISELGRGRFIWPLQGQMISDFGPKGAGQRNDGINVSAKAGDPVRAAAAGDVVYAGDQVPGFGNLVLIKHPDGWVTAYGHLSHVDVKMQQKVAQGQQIGQAGATGGVSEPQLHFEVRFAPSPLERARPIDPKLVLPK
ncbi:peptidase M24 [Phenylobacterium hankyongense]|uniref:Peptidase M24 n=1 Tax=Phenylobacterium hankyongense TaxID=1813876 RepID=A0A328B0X1_9CAUL|nr:LysM peptidoglycan-binding domain-containing protein [Phenylobacterium hankyongense]RAK61030.1 peptidase M24 [Phenylobacterium hankyongense]